MNANIFIVGASGHAKVVIATAEAAGVNVAGIFDDDDAKNGALLLGYRVVSPVPDVSWFSHEGVPIHIAIGDNDTRKRVAARLNVRCQSLVHPSAVVHSSAKIGAGALVCAQAVVHPDSEIGAHAIVNTSAVIEHDCRVGEFAHLGPRSCLTGGARAGTGAFLGAGVVVLPNVSIGNWSIAGAGAVVISDVRNGARVAGVPARDLRDA
ncbi:MAG TPA: acetyltransferase [Rhizomicrobium sp.]|nr:acetyltransferase [Rhizomicrobium sp.]